MSLVTVIDAFGDRQQIYISPTPYPLTAWSGPTFDATAYSNVTIWCWTAPSVAWAISQGDGSKFDPQTVVFNSSTGISTANSISAVGSYSLSGGTIIQISGGTGGTFSIQAS